MKYIKRDIENHFKKEADFYPIIAVIGARQVGKTTLIRNCFSHKQYINFEDPAVRDFFNTDPVSFIDKYKAGAIFDEVQLVPSLFSYLQILVDENKKNGQFIISGSQNLLISEKISQSLAGRVSIIELYPFSFNELRLAGSLPISKYSAIFTGAYPPVYDRSIPPESWYKNYIETYIQKDIRNLLKIRDINSFKKVLELCALNVGQLFNLEAIATASGVSRSTVYSWLSILEQTYIIYFLRPYHNNYSKRIIKTPKLYFYDTGVLCNLINLGENDLSSGINLNFTGHLFENLIVSEIKKEISNLNKNLNLYFWRDSNKHEIDLIIEKGGENVPIEIKMSSTFKSDYANVLIKWQNITNQNTELAYVIYGGSEEIKIKNIYYIPWNQLNKIFSHQLTLLK